MPAGCFPFVREHGDARVLALLNFTTRPLDVAVAKAFAGARVRVASRLAREGETVGAAPTLGPDEAVLIG